MQKRALITGITGQDGFYLAEWLLGQGYEVHGMQRRTSSSTGWRLEPIRDRIRLHHGDMTDMTSLMQVLRAASPHEVYNLAAQSSASASFATAASTADINAIGPARLLDALALLGLDGTRVFQASTAELFGRPPHSPQSEDTPFAPNSPYSASKASSDHLVRAFHHTYGLPVLTTNCSNNYGPFQFPEKLIPLMIQKLVKGEPLPVYGDGSNIRDWLFVGDHCAAIRDVLAGGRVGETYNVGGDAERRNIEVVHALCDAIDQRRPRADGQSRRVQITFVKDRPGHDKRYAIDASKLKRELGWAPTVSFEQGLARTIDWYLANAAWVGKILDGSYRLERIGTQA